MSEHQRPRYKETIDIEPDIDTAGGTGDSGRSKSNRQARSRKSRRNGRPEAWLKR